MSVLLCILDGWGCSTGSKYDAIHCAQTSYWDHLLKSYPHCQLATSGEAIGLPAGQMGNSEVGHMTIGSGRIVDHSLVRINKEILKLEQNHNFMTFVKNLQAKSGACHLMGLLSPGGVHSHMDHIRALYETITKYNIPVKLHAFLDGRDTPPQSALQYIEGFDIATVSGRYYAMDRDKNWERTEQVYKRVMFANSPGQTNARYIIDYYYHLGVTDEFIPPEVVDGYNRIKAQDSILMANFRPDRMKQLLHMFTHQSHFLHKIPILGMVEYSQELPTPSILHKLAINNTLGEIVSKNGLKQLRIAETEKYAHVTYFFNGGADTKYQNEKRILIPSPKVKTYDLKPEMSAVEITERLMPILEEDEFDLIVLNYANPDMVGHTGDMQATIKAVETIDKCLSEIIPITIRKNIDTIITADHGNAECMYDEESKSPHTAHTTGAVPLVLVSDKNYKLRNGKLSDIAPTILKLLNLPKPAEMNASTALF